MKKDIYSIDIFLIALPVAAVIIQYSAEMITGSVPMIFGLFTLIFIAARAAAFRPAYIPLRINKDGKVKE